MKRGIGLHEKAIADYDKALKLDPSDDTRRQHADRRVAALIRNDVITKSAPSKAPTAFFFHKSPANDHAGESPPLALRVKV